MTTHHEKAREILIAGLRNAHAIETQSVATFGQFEGSLGSYPELQAKLREAMQTSERQAGRVHTILENMGESNSSLKDAALTVMGKMQGMTQMWADDGAIKATLASVMGLSMHVSSYDSLLALAKEAGQEGMNGELEACRNEDKQLFEWFTDNVESITKRYVQVDLADENGEETPAERRAAS